MEPGYRLGDDDSVRTTLTTFQAIMQRVTFALGVADARAGRPFHRDTDLWHPNDAWAYERGRLWATLVSRHVPLKIGGKINPEAVRLYSRHRDEII